MPNNSGVRLSIFRHMLRPYLKKYTVTHPKPIKIAEQDFSRSRLFHRDNKGFYLKEDMIISSHGYLGPLHIL